MRVGLFAFAIFLALVFFEVLLRIFTPTPENLAKLKASSVFLHENNPSATFPYIRQGEFNNLITINSNGFRDLEFKTDKEEGVFRIAVLGDSFEEALQVHLSKSWQKIMAEKLSGDLKRKVETYNFGVSGYGTDQQWLTLFLKVWQFRPDMVILAFSPNDVGDTFKNRLVEVRNGKLEVASAEDRAGGNWLGKHFRKTYTYHILIRAGSGSDFGMRLVEKLRTKILGFPKDERFFMSDAQLVEGPFEVVASQKNPPLSVLQGWELVKALILDMRKQTEDHNAAFLVTVNIPGTQVSAEAWEKLRDLYKLPTDSTSFEINTDLAEFAKQENIKFYSPRDDAILWQGQNGIIHFPQDGHYNENGTLFMGTSVAKFILDNDLVGEAVVDGGN